jgi:hypothetical protein
MAAKKTSRSKSSRTVSRAKATKKTSVRKTRKAPSGLRPRTIDLPDTNPSGGLW